MNDRLKAMLNTDLRRTTAQPATPTLVKADSAPADDEAQEVVGASYGFVRGIRDRCLAIEFRLLDGNPFQEEDPAADYSLLSYRAWRRDGTGFRLEYLNGLKVSVRGRGLRQLYDRILTNRVLWVQEEGRDSIEDKADAAALRVYAIEVRREKTQEG